MENYRVTIKETSRELTARERIMLKDTTDATKLDEIVKGGESATITPEAYAILNIHNEKSDNKDYENYIILTTDGEKYVTGSPSFWSSFMEIWDEMAEANEPFSIKVYKRDSKNFKGKQFLTCSIL